jgi:hypothetical protein
MPWTGSSPNQNFQRTDGTRTGEDTWKDADNAGVKILSSDHDTHDEDIADGLSACLKKDGGNQATADISMGGFKLTNLGDASADTHALNRQTADARYISSDAGSVETANLAADAVTTAKIADNNVTTAKILDANVTEAKLAAATQTLLAQVRKLIGMAAGRFEYSSATECKLMPFNGECVSFPDGTVLDIPSSGVAVDNTGLSSDTVYYAYAYDDSGSLALEFSTTGHSRDANTGIEIKTGDATRVLVGAVGTNASTPGQLLDSATARQVASWHNRRPRQLLSKFTQERTTTASSFTEVNVEIRCGFFSWGDAVSAAFSSSVNCAATTWTGISLDGSSSVIFVTATQASAGGGELPVAPSGTFIPSEGDHYLTILAVRASGTSTFRVANEQSKLAAMVMI